MKTSQAPSLLSNWLIALALGSILLLGLTLRLYPGQDHWNWSWDQARDSYVIQSIIRDRNLVLIGPQSEFPGLQHGPLFYYLMSPFYFISQGSPTLPGLAMILLNLTTLIPLGLLMHKLFKNWAITLTTLFLFAISYEQIEYARWISNVSVAIPCLAWVYYFLWRTFEDRRFFVLLGVSVGLAIQAEIFLLYLIPVCCFFFLWSEAPLKKWLGYTAGVLVGVLPLALAELKFGFLGTRTFVQQFLGQHLSTKVEAGDALVGYFNQVGITTKHALFGLSNSMGLYVFFVLIGLVLYYIYYYRKIGREFEQDRLLFLLILLVSHSILFSFKFIEVVFVNIPFGLPLLMLSSYVIWHVWQTRFMLAVMGFGVALVVLQLTQLKSNVEARTPFSGYAMHQQGILYKDKMEIAAAVYKLGNQDGKPFSIAVLGTPYGVRTVWASILEEYARRHNTTLPKWFGYHANGYVGEHVLQPQDFPEANHILIIEADALEHMNETNRDEYLAQQNEATEVVKTEVVNHYTLELRRPRTATTSSLPRTE